MSREDFRLAIMHIIWSEHFEDGKETYLHNVPTIISKTAKQTARIERKTFKARNRTFIEDFQA